MGEGTSEADSSAARQMEILLLIIHQTDGPYDAMYEALSPHYAQYPFLKTYFVCFAAEMETRYRIAGDFIFIRGTESIVPGLLQKTIEAMLLTEAERYDFVVRSNSSTVINFDQLLKFLRFAETSNLHLLTGSRQEIAWLDPRGGITDTRYHGTRFASGTLIAMSRHATRQLLRYRHFLNFSVVDDVAIGIFFTQVAKIGITQIDRRFVIFNQRTRDFREKKDWLTAVQREINPVVWRNKSTDRAEDAKCIAWITHLLKAAP